MPISPSEMQRRRACRALLREMPKNGYHGLTFNGINVSATHSKGAVLEAT